MEKIKAEHIEYLIEKSIGDIRVACETNHDDKVIKNLEEYAVIFNWILWELIDCAKWKNDNRFSAKACGKQAYEILYEAFDTLKDEVGKDYIPVKWIYKWVDNKTNGEYSFELITELLEDWKEEYE